MRPYIEINAHHIGRSHVLNGLTCEDYSATYSDERLSIIVISDGHGDKNCFRSEQGAMHACDVAIRELRKFQSITDHIDDVSQCDFEALVATLESDIAKRWKEKVLRDAELNPFTDNELSKATEQAREVYGGGNRLEKAYGCTLIAAMATAGYWIAIQIGDGKCVAAYSEGVFVEPVPIDENCLGNRSTSLCNSNAVESFRHYYSNIKPVAVFVSSDGIEESFDQAGLYNCFYSVGFWLNSNGFEATKEKLDDLLPQISEGGSGDDVSIAVFASSDDLIAKPRQTLQQVYEKVSSCSDALEKCSSQLEEAKVKLAEIEERCDSTEIEIVELKEKLAEKEELFNAIAKDKETLDESVDELTARTEKATEQMDKAESFKASAESFWLPRLEKIGLECQPDYADEISDHEDRDSSLTEVPVDSTAKTAIEDNEEDRYTDSDTNDEKPGKSEEAFDADGDTSRDAGPASGRIAEEEHDEAEANSGHQPYLATAREISSSAEASCNERQRLLQLPEITSGSIPPIEQSESSWSYVDEATPESKKTEFSEASTTLIDDAVHLNSSEKRRWPLLPRSRRQGGESR